MNMLPMVEYDKQVDCPFHGGQKNVVVMGDGTWKCKDCGMRGQWLVSSIPNRIALKAE